MMIAVLMALCLAGTLALAHLYTEFGPARRDHVDALAWRHVHTDDLTFRVPDRWQPPPDGPDAVAGIEILIAVQDPAAPRRIVVGALQSDAPRSPAAALDQAIRLLRAGRGWAAGGAAPPLSASAWRWGMMTGLRHAGMDTAGVLHHITVLTTDARRYWLVWLSQPADHPSLYQPDEALLHEGVCRTLATRRWRPADDADRRRVGLDGPVPAMPELPEAVALVRAGQAPESPLLIAADGGEPGVLLLSVVASFDTSIVEPSDLPPTEDLLLRALAQASVPRPHDQLHTGHVHKRPAWRADFTPKHAHLTRSLWFLRLRGGRAAVLELLASPPLRPRGLGWIQSVAKAMDANLAPPLETSRSVVSAALARGAELGDAVRRVFATHCRPGQTYHLFTEGRQPLGCALHDILSRGMDPAMPLRGLTRQLWLQPGRAVMVGFTWQASPDLTRMRLEQHPPVRTDGDRDWLDGRRLEVSEGRITVSRALTGDRWRSVTSGAAPRAYIPPIADDNLPVERLQSWSDQPAILWMSHGASVPEPYWAHAGTATDGTVTVRLRPLVGVATTRLTLAPDGRVIQTVMPWESSHPLGGTPIITRRVERQDLLAHWPQLDAHLAQLDADDVPRP